MKDLTYDFIQSGALNAQETTWQNRYHAVVPDITKEGSVITLTSGGQIVRIEAADEIVLVLIEKFLFCPLWLVKKFLNKWMIAGLNDPDQKIESWVNMGLVWIEPSVTGQYLRPTYLLFKLFGDDPETFSNIPFNTLTHTISEQQVMFDVMSGNSPILKREFVHPRVSELGFDNDPVGTNILAEHDFRNPAQFKPDGIAELNDVENKINAAIAEGKNITPELSDFRQFVLAKKIDNTGTIRNDYKFHVPDLIIPVIRDKGKARSVAIEVELSNKRVAGYEETFRRYKDNNKYGAVYWLCASSVISDCLKIAHENIGGTGSCRMVIQEFQIPHPEY